MLFSNFIKTRLRRKESGFWGCKIASYDQVDRFAIPHAKLYDILKNPSELEKYNFPDPCIIKYNNLWAGMCVVRHEKGRFVYGKRELGRKGLVKLFQKFKLGRGRIMVEELLKDSTGGPHLHDIKFYCFNGKPRCYYIWQEHPPGPKCHYTMDGKRILLQTVDAPLDFAHPTPKHFDELVAMAELLAARLFPTTFVRIDFYSTTRGPAFSEFTYFPSAGKNFTREGDKWLTQWF
jgi:hypothetical protein